MWGRCYV
ncbi:hypothetical protein MTR67_052689 [Solanum verrucosum]|nr:hypothetical protein MTR67_052689 [Solanum verrucosum]